MYALFADTSFGYVGACVAVYCSVLQCVVVCCSVLQCVAVFPYHFSSVCDVCSIRRHILWLRRGVCSSVLQSVAVCCSVLQCFRIISQVCVMYTLFADKPFGYVGAW